MKTNEVMFSKAARGCWRKRIITAAVILFLAAAAGSSNGFASYAEFELRQIYNMPSDSMLDGLPAGNAKYLFSFFKAIGCREGQHRIVDYMLNDKEIMLVATVQQAEGIYELCRDPDNLPRLTLTMENQLYPAGKEVPVAAVVSQGKEAEVRTIAPGIRMTPAAKKYLGMMQ